MNAKYLLAIFLCTKFAKADKYLEESQDYCQKTNYLTSCGKYKMLNLFKQFAQPITNNGSGVIRLIKVNETGENEQLFTSSRFLSEDTEISKFTKFLRRTIFNFLDHQGVAISLPRGLNVLNEGAQIDEGRAKKKKFQILLSLITLFKVFNIKAIAGLTLASVILLKKIVFLGGLHLFSVLQTLKVICKQKAVHHEEVHDFHDLHDTSSYGGKDYESYYSPYSRKIG